MSLFDGLDREHGVIAQDCSEAGVSRGFQNT